MSTDKEIQEKLKEKPDKSRLTIDQIQDELKEKLAYVQILTVKDLKERGHNFHPCKYTKIVCTGSDAEGKSIGPFVVFNEAYSNKTVPIDILNKGTLTFTFYNYDTTKCTQTNKPHQKIAVCTSSIGTITSIPIEGDKIQDLKFVYPDSNNLVRSFATILPLFFINNFLSTFPGRYHKLKMETCRHKKTLSINVYPKFNAKVSVCLGKKNSSFETSAQTAKTDSGSIRSTETKESGKKFVEWSVAFKAEIGNFKFELTKSDPVVKTIETIAGGLAEMKKLEEQLGKLLDGNTKSITTKQKTIEITYPTFNFGAQVESILAGIKRKHEFTAFVSFDPLIGIKFTLDILAAASNLAAPAKLIIKIRDFFKSQGWGDLYCELIINGMVSGLVEGKNTELKGTINGKISVSLNLGLKITLEGVKLEASASLSGGIYAKAVLTFNGNITLSADIGNENLGLTAIFNVKLKFVVEWEHKESLDFIIIEKNTLKAGLGPYTIPS